MWPDRSPGSARCRAVIPGDQVSAPNGGSARGYQELSAQLVTPPRPSRQAARPYVYAWPALGLAIYREFGPPDNPGVVFFLGPGLLEVSGHPADPAGHSVRIWIQVRDVHAEHARLAAAESYHPGGPQPSPGA